MENKESIQDESANITNNEVKDDTKHINLNNENEAKTENITNNEVKDENKHTDLNENEDNTESIANNELKDDDKHINLNENQDNTENITNNGIRDDNEKHININENQDNTENKDSQFYNNLRSVIKMQENILNMTTLTKEKIKCANEMSIDQIRSFKENEIKYARYLKMVHGELQTISELLKKIKQETK
jgi:hypothetical protein